MVSKMGHLKAVNAKIDKTSPNHSQQKPCDSFQTVHVPSKSIINLFYLIPSFLLANHLTSTY